MILGMGESPGKQPLFKAPCNITENNIIEAQIDFNTGEHKVMCVRYQCGQIKWRRK